jgi:hypothetical protein
MNCPRCKYAMDAFELTCPKCGFNATTAQSDSQSRLQGRSAPHLPSQMAPARQQEDDKYERPFWQNPIMIGCMAIVVLLLLWSTGILGPKMVLRSTIR